MPKVVNCHHDRSILSHPKALYIGRPKQKGNTYKHFGNPFSHLPGKGLIQVGSRAEAISAFKGWLIGSEYLDIAQDQRTWILENIGLVLEADFLVCWCTPQPCHGETLIDIAEYLNRPRTNLKQDLSS